MSSKDVTGNALPERTVGGLHEALLRHLPPTLGLESPILDLGCGSGAWLHRLHSRGFQNLTGTDIDASQVRAGIGEIFQVDLDAAFWALPKRRYTLITAIEVIEHLSNIGTFLENVAQLLSEDGVVLITTPNIHSIQARLRFLITGETGQFGVRGDQTHLFPVIIGTFPRLLARYGFELERAWGYPDNGSTLTSRALVNRVARVMRLWLPEPIPGDTLGMSIVKREA
jgi:SAM-dependent methyltransferase